MRSSGDNSWCSDGVATDDRDKLVALMLSIYQDIWATLTPIEIYFETAMQGIVRQAAMTLVRVRCKGVVCI